MLMGHLLKHEQMEASGKYTGTFCSLRMSLNHLGIYTPCGLAFLKRPVTFPSRCPEQANVSVALFWGTEEKSSQCGPQGGKCYLKSEGMGSRKFQQV